MKLHLGCGESYLLGYVNIDFPGERHTVQMKRVADKYADILTLKYPRESIEEIRLHHVFEHFPRPVACALLVCWREWLITGGILRLEVPDFWGTAKTAISRWSPEHAKNVALRHIFGSQEAPWASHYEGWSREKLGSLLKRYKYQIVKASVNKYKGVSNLEIFAKKYSEELSRIMAKDLTENYLATHLVDSTPTEKRLLSVWMKVYDDQVENSWPK